VDWSSDIYTMISAKPLFFWCKKIDFIAPDRCPATSDFNRQVLG
jgi:hypothetical protein